MSISFADDIRSVTDLKRHTRKFSITFTNPAVRWCSR
jgi:hypothetical protein